MGHSGTVPGSLAAEDIRAALEGLEQAVTAGPDRPLKADRNDSEDDEKREPLVSMAHRALPLIEMLKSAMQENDYVIWDR